MKTILTLALLLLLARGASALSLFGDSRQTQADNILRVFNIMMDNGARGSGPKNSSEFHFYFQHFNGDFNEYTDDKIPTCDFVSRDEKGEEKRFNVRGDSCKTMITSLQDAGLAKLASHGLSLLTLVA